MCGIFGFFGPSERLPTRRNASHALATLGHRGPDAHGLHHDQPLGLVLGHTRLSIIDPAHRSDQPFEYAGNLLVFNGEIYNFRELRQELEGIGAKFRTSSDTEVIAAGYHYWGVEVFRRLLGMYAVALYDVGSKCLHLARDEFGIKPLCFLQRGGEIIFSSEIKAIAVLRSLSINDGALVDLLQWGFQMEDASLYSEVSYLAPGHVLSFHRGEVGRESLVEQRKIACTRDAYRHDLPITSSALQQVLASSVRDHMISDVPVAVALSGGIDSSIVATLAAQQHAEIEAFTFTLSRGTDPEVEHAAMLAKHVGLKHHVARLIPGGMEGYLKRIAWHLEEPIANINSLLSYGLASLVREQGFKVMLVGEGADEVFAGYPWYRFAFEHHLSHDYGKVFDAYYQRRAQKRVIACLRPKARLFAEHRLLNQREIFSHHMQDFREIPLNGFLSFDQKTQLQYSQLLRVDRMFMAHGVEARVPFLYRPVLEASARLPVERKMQTGVQGLRAEKVGLAEAFEHVLPHEILRRPKFGEAGTVNLWTTWLAGMLAGEFKRCLESRELRGARQLLGEYLDWEVVASQSLSVKEQFAFALLIESVDALMFSKEIPDVSLPMAWEVLA